MDCEGTKVEHYIFHSGICAALQHRISLIGIPHARRKERKYEKSDFFIVSLNNSLLYE